MSKERRVLIVAGVVALAVAASGAAMATQSVIVNNNRYTCQHECKVMTMPGGGIGVMDTQGGWVRDDGPLSPEDPPLEG